MLVEGYHVKALDKIIKAKICPRCALGSYGIFCPIVRNVKKTHQKIKVL